LKYLALIDPRLPEDASQSLEKLDILPLRVPICETVDAPISGHPDIQFFYCTGTCFAQPETPSYFIRELEKYTEVRPGHSVPVHPYPDDISYNIALAGKHAFHRADSTDPAVSAYLRDKKIEQINVPQGYSKCSVMVVDDRSIVTSDRKIHEAALECGKDSLLVTAGHIKLPGYSYGFIGGISGSTDEHVLLTGTINRHPDRERIEKFIESKGKETVYLSEEEAVDGGSILIIPLKNI